MKIQSTAVRGDLQTRLRRIEGQVRGVQKMLDEDRECHEIVQQLNAIRAAVENATRTFIRSHAKECLLQLEEMDRVERVALIDDLTDLMAKVK